MYEEIESPEPIASPSLEEAFKKESASILAAMEAKRAQRLGTATTPSTPAPTADENAETDSVESSSPEVEDFPLDGNGEDEGGEPAVDEPGMDLDPELAKDKKLADRWAQQQKGIQKLVDRNKAVEAELGSFHGLMKALENPATVQQAFQFLSTQLATLHGAAFAAQAKPAEAPSVPTEADLDRWDELGYESRGEYLAELRATERARKEMEQRLAAIAPDLDEVRGELRRGKEAEAQKAAAKAEADKIDAVAPKVAARIAAEDDGWKVTRDMVAEAVKALPQFRDKPTEAVRKWFSDERVAHLTRAARTPKAPEMVGGRSTPKGTATRPDKTSMFDILTSVGYQNR